MGRQGAPQREIAAAAGISQGRVSQLLAGRGQRARSSNAARDQAIRAAADADVPVRELARLYGVSRARVYQILAASESI